jgi:UDP-galactose transporter B1
MMTPLAVPRHPSEKEKGQKSVGTLLFYSAGIYIFYLLYGYFQEYLMKVGRFGVEQEKFQYNAFLLFVQGLFNLMIAFLAIKSSGERVKDDVPALSYAISAATQLAAMSFSFYALSFVDYPTQALAKACKPIPVMVMGLLFFSKRYHWSKYITVAIITGGISVFMKEQEEVQSKSGEDHGLFGIFMLLISLSMDGLTGPIQDKLVDKHNPTANHLMFHSNLYSSLFSLVSVISLGELGPAIEFCHRNPNVWIYIIGQSLASALGQLFIFRLIRSFGSLSLSIITTSRKFFSILLSIVWFGHTLTTLQWTSILAVFLGLSFDLISPKARSPSHSHSHHHHHHHHQNHHHHQHQNQHQHHNGHHAAHQHPLPDLPDLHDHPHLRSEPVGHHKEPRHERGHAHPNAAEFDDRNQPKLNSTQRSTLKN